MIIEPSTTLIIEPSTTLIIEPPTTLIIEPLDDPDYRTLDDPDYRTLIIEPPTILIIEPPTILIIEPSTILIIEPSTILIIEPSTTLIIEPSTTLIIEPSKAGVVATLNRRVAAITAAHRMAGQGFDASHTAIANVLAGIRRAHGTRQDEKTALLTKVEHDRLFGQSVSHQLFSSDGKRCTLCLGVADRLDLEFRWPCGPNSRSGSTISRSRDAPRRLHHGYGRPGALIAADGSCVLAGPGAGPGRGPKRDTDTTRVSGHFTNSRR